MAVLYFTDERCRRHIAGSGHPEQPARLDALTRGLTDAGLLELVQRVTPTPAPVDALERVHEPRYIAALDHFCSTGGGNLDADTGVVPESFDAALLAAGSGLDAIAALRRGDGDAAFCAVRPPGHHAMPGRAMGFCLFNNIAVAAAALASDGERVLIVDFDVHHGNGTQAMFWTDPRVAYASIHQSPLYPGTGEMDEIGDGPGSGGVLNVPVPAGATGDVYLKAVDDLVVPFGEHFAPDWLLLSAGFDAHRDDPLAGVDLSSGDFGLVTSRLARLVPRGRQLAFLEGGYSLDAVSMSGAATIAGLVGEACSPEKVTNGGPGRDTIDFLIGKRDRRQAGSW